jgi:energy-coupling factor transporter ATP-binding protein EcfA2
MHESPIALDRSSSAAFTPSRITVEAQGLGCRFDDGLWIFRSIDLKLRAGEIAVLAGRNGVGKTILAKHLAGLIPPTEGRVLAEGKDLSSIAGSIAPHVGYVFQDARLQTVGDTVVDDVLFGPTCLGLEADEALEKAQSALDSCGLADKAKHFVHDLSGGELRRLAIAGVLAMRPKTLILDEPFANLDPAGVRDILELVRDLAMSGMALLVISHEIEKVLGLASSFAVMDAGRIVLSGDPESVLREGVEAFGLRDPFRPRTGIADLAWL